MTPRSRSVGVTASSASGAGVRTGRPPLTERRKDATRLEIAREAVRLFTERGVQATSGEDIARAAGISPRTLWRYFSAKEQCVRPLLTRELTRVAQRLVELPAGRPLAAVVEDDGAERYDDEDAEGASAVRALIRLTREEPSILAVWLQVHHEAEAVFAGVLAERLGLPADSLDVRVRASMINGALRSASEDWALAEISEADAVSPAHRDTVRRAMRIVTDGLDC
ncbi:TetR/AcrR family transcriptional regulator [Streptomyces sp. NPDC057074]|uniref:TetR/AcrR family transcriptional regulator n=1 Tax=Streptomyces sp. NPDC057074 TaxID=3346015 RepID=UPI00362B098D